MRMVITAYSITYPLVKQCTQFPANGTIPTKHHVYKGLCGTGAGVGACCIMRPSAQDGWPGSLQYTSQHVAVHDVNYKEWDGGDERE